MTNFAEMPAEGDLRSEGLANEVAKIASEQLDLSPDLLGALEARG